MLKSNAKIVSIYGMRGCGKSTLTQLQAEGHPRKVVFDYVQEWEGDFVVESYDEFSAIWREQFHKPKYTILIHFRFGLPIEEIQETSAKIVTLIYSTGKQTQISTCLIFEECQFYFPNNSLHPVFLSLLTTGRHAFINILANTQRPASIHKLLISQSAEIFVGTLYEANDIKYLMDTVGSIAIQARGLKPREFIFYPAGFPENIAIFQI